jgi:hypothetical protein
MQRLKWPSSQHRFRVTWLGKYDRWRRRHAQRWRVQDNLVHVQQLNRMVDECHAFMQSMVNQYVRQLHGEQAVRAHARPTQWDWTTIQCQMMAST